MGLIAGAEARTEADIAIRRTLGQDLDGPDLLDGRGLDRSVRRRHGTHRDLGVPEGDEPAVSAGRQGLTVLGCDDQLIALTVEREAWRDDQFVLLDRDAQATDNPRAKQQTIAQASLVPVVRLLSLQVFDAQLLAEEVVGSNESRQRHDERLPPWRPRAALLRPDPARCGEGLDLTGHRCAKPPWLAGRARSRWRRGHRIGEARSGTVAVG